MGNVKREAIAPRRGYLYQDYRTAIAWLELKDGEVLFVEVAEDYVKIVNKELVATQVKDLSRNITLNDEGARSALASFVELKRLNSNKAVKYAFITTATASVEQRTQHRASPAGSISYWQRVQEGGEIAPLRRVLLAMSLSPELHEFIKVRSEDQLREDLVTQFDWHTGALPIGRLAEDLEERVIARLRQRGVERAQGKKYVGAVLRHVIELAQHTDRDERRLDKPGLEELLDRLATRSMSAQEFEELTTKAAIADNLPKDVLDSNVLSRINALKSSRYFVGYDKVAAARALAADIRLPGKYSGASDDVREMALSWSARVLLDEQPELAAELIEAAKELVADSEMARLTGAIRSAVDDVSLAFSEIENLTSPQAMTARYIIQRRSVKGPIGFATAIAWFEQAGLGVDELDEDGQALLLGDLMRTERWNEVTRFAALIDTENCVHPSLLLTCALANLCQAAPIERRDEILEMPPLWDPLGFPLAATAMGMAARARAIELFDRLRTVAINLELSLVSDHALEYMLWLKLAEAPHEQNTMREIEMLVSRSEDWERWVPLAISAGVKVSISTIRQRLQHRYIRLGSHNFSSARALLATILIGQGRTSSGDWRAYENQLATHFSDAFLISLEVQICLQDDNIEGARTALNRLEFNPDTERTRNRLEILISARGSTDLLTKRREAFLRTGEMFDLQQLITSLSHNQLWPEVADYSREMFNRSKSVDSAIHYVSALKMAERWSELVGFFEQYPEFSRHPGELADTYAQFCLLLGRWRHLQEALAGSPLSEALARKVQHLVSLLTFQWDDFNSQIDEALAMPNKYAAEALLEVASVAATIGRDTDSKKLAAHAADTAPADPKILMSSYLLAAKGMWDNEEIARTWLKLAIEQSGDDGVLQRHSLADLIERIPKWRKQNERAWSALRSGELWLGAYAKSVNQQLSQITVGAAINNANLDDVRRRSIVLAYSGVRQPLTLAVGKRVAVDMTALMTLAYLGLLDKLRGIYSRIFVPHYTGAWLFEDIQHSEFHQPKLIEDAGRLLGYIAQERIQVCSKVIIEDTMLIPEVGPELADLLHRAKELQGTGQAAFVISTAPIHLVDSLLEREADLAHYEGVLRSLGCLIETLDLHGLLTARERERAQVLLLRVDRRWSRDAEIPAGTTLLLDDLAVSYIQSLELLPQLARSKFKLIIHSKLRDQAREYAELRESGRQLRNVLYRVREFLTAGVRSGEIEVLPLPYEHWGQPNQPLFPTTDIFLLQDKFDSILIDDRLFNKHHEITRENGEAISINCTLDVIDHLRDTGILSDSQWISHRTELRRGGYALIPVTEQELATAVQATHVRSDVVTEGRDFRAIREAALLVQMRGVLSLPLEHAWLETLLKAWNELLIVLLQVTDNNRQSVLVKTVLDLSDVRNFGDCFPGEMSAERLRFMGLTSYARLMAASMFLEESGRPSDTVTEIFDTLLWHSPVAHEQLVAQSKAMLFRLKEQLIQTVPMEDRPRVPTLLWSRIRQLPKSLRIALVEDESVRTNLALPIEPQLQLNIFENPKFNSDVLYSAVAKVLQGAESVEVADCDKKSWIVRRNSRGQAVLDVVGHARPLVFPDIEYMFDDPQARVAHFISKCTAAGVSIGSLDDTVLADLGRAPLTSRKINEIQTLLLQFPIARHDMLMDDMQRGGVTLGTMFPSQLAYYEHMVGEWQGEPDILTFAARATPEQDEAVQFDTRLLIGLLSCGHSATSPHLMIVQAGIPALKAFIADHVLSLDIWSLTAFLEGLFRRGDAAQEFKDEILQLLSLFDRLVNQTMDRCRSLVALVRAADIRIRSLSPCTDPPPYWRRLASIGQAALIERALIRTSGNIEPYLETLEPMAAVYFGASIIDMQREPAWAPLLLNEHQLQQELLGRVLAAWFSYVDIAPAFETHREEFASTIQTLQSSGDMLMSTAPGPTEGSIALQELPAIHHDALERLLGQLPTKALHAWMMAARIGTTVRLPKSLHAKLLASVEQYGAQVFAGHTDSQSIEVLAWLAYLAASGRDTALATLVIKQARAAATASQEGIVFCLYVSVIALAAYEDRQEWQALMVECASHAAYSCSDRTEAMHCLAAIENFVVADWRLQLPLANARAALNGLIHQAGI